MPATPASTRRRATSRPRRSPGTRPERSFTVSGSPLPSIAPRAIATALSGSSSSEAPAPVFPTFLTGQPMLMSIRSAPASRAFSAAIFMTSGSCPKSWIETGCSSGWMRRNSRSVRLSPYLIPKLDTISDTASPAPWRRACMRMNQLPMPASGASTARFGRRMPPSSQGSVIMRGRLERHPRHDPRVVTVAAHEQRQGVVARPDASSRREPERRVATTRAARVHRHAAAEPRAQYPSGNELDGAGDLLLLPDLDELAGDDAVLAGGALRSGGALGAGRTGGAGCAGRAGRAIGPAGTGCSGRAVAAVRPVGAVGAVGAVGPVVAGRAGL